MSVSQFVASAGVLLDGVMILNGTVDVDGTANGLKLDADGDTTIAASTNNQIDVTVGGGLDFSITSNLFSVLSGSALGAPGSTFARFSPIAAQQNLSGAGTINITTTYTACTSTGAGQALALADGVIKGHYKRISHVVDGGSLVLTPSHLSGGTTITFTTVGEIAELVFDGSNWVAVALYNSSTPGTPPVLA